MNNKKIREEVLKKVLKDKEPEIVLLGLRVEPLVEVLRYGLDLALQKAEEKHKKEIEELELEMKEMTTRYE